MKLGSLLIAASLAPALFCHAQDKAPAAPSAAQDAAKPDAGAPDGTPPQGSDLTNLFGRLGHSKSKAAPQATAKPAAPEATAPAPQAPVKPVAQDAAKPAGQDAAKPAGPDAASSAAQATPGAAAPDAADSYVIGASDSLNVTVFKEPTVSGSFLVRPDGMISIPLLGDVKASGKTPMQLAEEIKAKLKKFIQDPNVTVILSQINSKKVFLIGEVGRTGPIEMTPGMTFLEAVATAGGLTQFANAKKIYILRTEDGKQEKIPVQYKQALAGAAALNLVLKPGDTIVVP
jgi:polysaccharide export outer membrane protein